MQFLELVETISAEAATRERLFNRNEDGSRMRRLRSPRYLAQLAEAVKFVNQVFTGVRPMHQLTEAMSTSDFPSLFGDIIDRQLLGYYQEANYSWNIWCRRRTVPDFRTVKRFAVDGSESTLSEVGEQAEYPEGKVQDGVYSYAVKKYGRRVPFSWASMINDDLDALKDIPKRLGKAARRTEEKLATQLIADANGPHATFFTSGHKNLVTTANGASSNNPALSIAGLQDAFIVLGNMLDVDGDPIDVEAVTLVVPPALEVIAQNILNGTELWLNAGGGASNQQLHTLNWMRTRLKLAKNSYLPIVSSSANGGTSWYLVADPEAGRPAFEMGFLRGHETPEIFMKAPNSQRVGGGQDPMDGDFDTDSIEYKVRHVVGTCQMDYKMAVASNGSGS